MKGNSDFYFQWHFLNSCNLRCTHCYQEDYSQEHLPLETLLSIANHMNDCMRKWNKKGRISLTGGEPFLKNNLLFPLLDSFEAAENFNWIGILSNGTLINSKVAERLSKYKKIAEVQISIDGASKESHESIRGLNTFDAAMDSLQVLKQNGIFTSIMFTLHKKNADEVIKVLNLAEQIGIDAITIERITPIGRTDINKYYLTKEKLKTVYESIYIEKNQIEKRSNLKVRVSRPLWNLLDTNIGGFCPAGLSSLSILPDGTVLPCRRLEIPIGNIVTDRLYKIWYTSDILWRLRNKSNLLGKCHDCKKLYACGGCRAIAYAISNDYMAEDPQCWL